MSSICSIEGYLEAIVESKPLSKKLKLVFSSTTKWWNAEASYAVSLAEALQGAGHRVYFITPPKGAHADELNKKKLSQLPLPNWPNSPWAAQRLRHFLRQKQIDVLHLFNSPELLPSCWAVRGLPTILARTRGKDQNMKSHVFNRLLLKRCQLIVASSQAVQKDMQRALYPFQPKIPIIYYPSPRLENMPSAAAVQEHRHRWLRQKSLSRATQLLIMVGRIAPEKGHFSLLQALPPICKAYPQLAVLMLNKDQGSPELRHKLYQAARRLGVDSYLHWLGWQDNIFTWMAAADIGIIPSLSSEMNCRIAMEFLAMQTPIVAFPTGSIPEVLQHKKNAWITSDHQPQQLTTAILELLKHPQQRAKLSQQGAKEVYLSQKYFLQQYLDLYQSAQSARTAP